MPRHTLIVVRTTINLLIALSIREASKSTLKVAKAQSISLLAYYVSGSNYPRDRASGPLRARGSGFPHALRTRLFSLRSSLLLSS